MHCMTRNFDITRCEGLDACPSFCVYIVGVHSWVIYCQIDLYTFHCSTAHDPAKFQPDPIHAAVKLHEGSVGSRNRLEEHTYTLSVDLFHLLLRSSCKIN